ncbi:hypothetical protein [Pedobacter glucosidilyticus]|uniref:hypothetical protein n=1 Tax=Pedobacter glucosidilyticus TaxID=1122941 RepID=UPI0026EFFA4C|nr:hypothetical protein [Pedobacter glucosidilyticus]
MSYKTLTYLQMKRLYYKKGKEEIQLHLAGQHRKAAALLRTFLETEHHTFKCWYYALQMHLLQKKDIEVLLQQKSAKLKLHLLSKHGIEKSCLKQLKAKLLSLLVTYAYDYSCAALLGKNPGYRIRIYSLPLPFSIHHDDWETDAAQNTNHYLN